MLGTIVSSANWVAGSMIVAGNIFLLPDSGTTTTNKVYVGTQEALGIAAGGLNFVTNGSQSGAVVKDNGTVAFGTRIVTCTGTGGNVKVSGGAKYDTCIVANPLTTTGAIQSISLMVSASPVAVGIDCGFVKGLNSGTGTAFTNLGNMATGTGLTLTFSTGSLQWNPVDYIKCGTLGTPTTSFAAKLRVQYFDTTSE
jgi:hypothetical protein